MELAAARLGRRDRRRLARQALAAVGLGGYERRLPAQMSGGEQQRVGIARATVTNPPLIVADEPTGALDQANGHAVFDLLASLTRRGTTVVFITHDLALADSADRIVSMIDGRIESITERGALR
jgi:putative ABC transport system ATP-binding protein